MSEERIKELESSVEGQVVAPAFTSSKLGSPVGDAALGFLDAEFSRIQEYLNLKLPDGFLKPLVLVQVQVAYSLLRGIVSTALS